MIEICSINPINKGDIVASVSVHIKPWKLKIHEIMVFQKGMNRWIAMPSRKYENGGETKYVKLMEFDDSGAEKRFRDQITKAIDEYIETHDGLVPEDVIKDEPLPF